jgi:hypothetical protein
MTKYDEPRIYIRVPSASEFLVTCDGEEVSNWRDLQAEARAAVEPLVREQAFWEDVQSRKHHTLEELMRMPMFPSREYPCPAELAAKVVL